MTRCHQNITTSMLAGAFAGSGPVRERR